MTPTACGAGAQDVHPGQGPGAGGRRRRRSAASAWWRFHEEPPAREDRPLSAPPYRSAAAADDGHVTSARTGAAIGGAIGDGALAMSDEYLRLTITLVVGLPEGKIAGPRHAPCSWRSASSRSRTASTAAAR